MMIWILLVGALVTGYVIGIAHAAVMDTNMHCRDQQAADNARQAAQQEYARRDAQCRSWPAPVRSEPDDPGLNIRYA